VPVAVFAAIIAFLPQTISLVSLYPHLLSYYSETVGGLPGATRLGLETTYWCETYMDALPYLNAHARPGDIIWTDPWSHNVMIYYQLHGRLRSDVKIAFTPYAPPSLFAEAGPPTTALFYDSDFLVFQYRQTGFGQEDVLHPDLQWLSQHQPVYRLSYEGIPLMDIFSKPENSTVQIPSITQESETEPGNLKVQVPSNMQEFKSEAGNFAVQAPPDLMFAETAQAIDSGNLGMGKLSLHILMSVTREGSYQIYYFDYPADLAANPNASPSLLDGARQGWLNAIQGRLTGQEHPISLGNHPGREASVEAKNNNQDIKIKIRYYLVQNRIYQIMVSVPKDGKFTAEMNAFLQSFTLLKN
jgi:hypothetical protein